MASISSPPVVGFSNQMATASPNNVIPCSYFIASGSQASIDAVIGPKLAGALLCAIPDNAATGGNKRGNYATDLQRARSLATQVASGQTSTAIGGDNTASGAGAVALGLANVASGSLAPVAIGNGNTSSADYATSVGGTTNTASGQAAATLGGQNNTASGFLGRAYGQLANDRGTTGAEAHANGSFTGASGVAQRRRMVFSVQTTDAVAKAMSAGGGVLGAANACILPTNGTYLVSGSIVARNITSGVAASAWRFEVVARKVGAGSIVLVAAAAVTLIAQDAGLAATVLAVAANAVLDSVDITVTGLAATTINWVADVETVEVVG